MTLDQLDSRNTIHPAPPSTDPAYVLVVAEEEAPWPSWALSALESDWQAMTVAQAASDDPLELPQYVTERLECGRRMGWRLERVVLAVGPRLGRRTAWARELIVTSTLEELARSGGELIAVSMRSHRGLDDPRLRQLLDGASIQSEELSQVRMSIFQGERAPRSGVFVRRKPGVRHLVAVGSGRVA